jgi:hypothetical protein
MRPWWEAIVEPEKLYEFIQRRFRNVPEEQHFKPALL